MKDCMALRNLAALVKENLANLADCNDLYDGLSLAYYNPDTVWTKDEMDIMADLLKFSSMQSVELIKSRLETYKEAIK